MTGRQRRHKRVRKKITGTEKKPRLSVYRSLKYIYAQLIDDEKGHTLAAATTKTDVIKRCAKTLVQKAKKKKIESVVFDRGGYKYHGRIKAFAEAVREAGLKF